VLYAAFENMTFPKEDAAEVLNIGPSGAYKQLQRMKEQGIVSSEKVGKELHYTFI